MFCALLGQDIIRKNSPCELDPLKPVLIYEEKLRFEGGQAKKSIMHVIISQCRSI